MKLSNFVLSVVVPSDLYLASLPEQADVDEEYHKLMSNEKYRAHLRKWLSKLYTMPEKHLPLEVLVIRVSLRPYFLAEKDKMKAAIMFFVDQKNLLLDMMASIGQVPELFDKESGGVDVDVSFDMASEDPLAPHRDKSYFHIVEVAYECDRATDKSKAKPLKFNDRRRRDANHDDDHYLNDQAKVSVENEHF